MPVPSTVTLPGMRHDYNEHSKGQLQVLAIARPYLQKAIEAHSATLPSTGNPFILADFGCSAGANSSAAIDVVISLLRDKYGFERTKSIIAVHEDLPNNPWSAVFQHISANPSSYMFKHEGAFGLAAGRSFYERILPNESLQVGVTMCAVHWISRCPVKIRDHCIPALGSDDEKAAFAKQAAEDWRKFLTMRAAELAKGGVLVCHIVGGNTQMMNKICDPVYQACKVLCHEGIINDDELLNFNVGIVSRSLDDVTDPGLLAELSLEVVTAEEALSTDAYDKFKNEILGSGDDEGTIAAKFADTILSCMEPLFRSSLDLNRSEPEKASIAAKFEAKCREAFKKLGDLKATSSSASKETFVVFKKKF